MDEKLLAEHVADIAAPQLDDEASEIMHSYIGAGEFGPACELAVNLKVALPGDVLRAIYATFVEGKNDLVAEVLGRQLAASLTN